MKRRNEDGFTLVELVVVVLIIGVLLALAIPTFLSLTSSSRSNGAEANVVIAGDDEVAYFNQNGSYGAISLMNAADGGLHWQPCSRTACVGDAGGLKDIYVWPSTDAGGYATVVLGDAGANGSFYWELLSQNPGIPSPTYQVTQSAIPATVAAFEASGARSWSQAGG